MLEYSPQTMEDAEATWARLQGFVTRASERVGEVGVDEVRAAQLPEPFVEAMDDLRDRPDEHVKVIISP